MQDYRHPPGTGALVKALTLVEIVEEKSTQRLRAQDIAKEAGIPPSTAYRILQVLTDFGYLRFDRRDHAYEPGKKIVQGTASDSFGRAIGTVGHAFMERLASLTGETVTLSVLEKNRARIITRVSHDPKDTGLFVEWGQTRPLHCTGLGKCLLAWRPQAQRDEVLDQVHFERITRKTLTDRKALEEDLQRARDRGFAIENGEVIEGISCLAVPILDRNGTAIAALSLSAPTSRLNEDRYSAVSSELYLVAENIKLRLNKFWGEK